MNHIVTRQEIDALLGMNSSSGKNLRRGAAGNHRKHCAHDSHGILRPVETVSGPPLREILSLEEINALLPMWVTFQSWPDSSHVR